MTTEDKLKEIIVRDLKLTHIKAEDIKDDDFLFGEEGLGLDSLDAVELVVILQRHFNCEIKDMQKVREIFTSIKTLSDYIRSVQNAT
ncbi:MAG: phosphopantetheine-binding protein [Nitrospirae bacterium YQR-1]